MLSTPPFHCLFCKHLNPAAAIFCNECGMQLNLQPCKRCGAIDGRAAKKCYKCGTSFMLTAQPGPESLLAPATPDKGLASSTLSDAGPADTLQTQSTPDMADASPGLQEEAQKFSSETDANAIRSRRRWHMAIAGVLLVLAIDMVFVYFYYGAPEQLAQTEIEKTEGVKQVALEVLVEPRPDGLTPPNLVMPVDAALKPEDTSPNTVTLPQAPENVLSRAPPKAVATLDVRPLPTTADPVKSRQESTFIKECPQAVAALGLCNPPTNE